MYLKTKTIAKTLTAVLLAMIIAVIPLMKVTAAKSKDSDFEEITVVDIDETTITITDIDEDGTWGYTLKVTIENKSEDITYMYTIDNASLNGVCVDPYFSVEVKPGKKLNEEIEFYMTDEEKELIGEVTDIHILMYAYDSDDWSADNIFDEDFHIYPKGEDNAEDVIREDDDEDVVLSENDDVRFILTGIEWDDTWGYELSVYMVNNTDKNVVFTIDDASINGYMVDVYWADYLMAQTSALGEITFYLDDLEKIDITEEDEIEDLEFYFSVYDSDDWSAPDIYNEDISLTIN